MNAGHDNASGFDGRSVAERGFDERLRLTHARAVDNVSARTRLQLKPQRQPVRAPRGLQAWPIAATCAIALVAGGLFLREPARNGQPGAPAGIATAPANAAADDIEAGEIYAALDESPELYLWLASNDTESLALE